MINSIPSHHAGWGLKTPKWISTVLASIFLVQWSFTMLPHTVGVRNSAFVVGVILGAYIIAKNYRLLLQKKALPIWLIFLLFIWVAIHLFFIGRNHDLQLAEFLSLWKRAGAGVIFAIGLGISITQTNQLRDWRIIIAGLSAPLVIYLIKYISTYYLPILGLRPPAYLMLFYGSSEFYVPKISYVFFCLPLLAIALGVLTNQLKKQMKGQLLPRWFWVLAFFAVMNLFVCENIKNGIVFSFIAVIIFLATLFFGNILKFSKPNLVTVLTISLISFSLIFYSFHSNPSWKTFHLDFEVASQLSPEDIWPDGAGISYEYPRNKLGLTVSPSNFERLFFLKNGVQLLVNNPLGYGLVQSSFGHLLRERWTSAPLVQSHSGWLDLMLGLGFPGVLLLLAASLLAIFNVSLTAFPGSVFGFWGLGSILLLYTTTEVAQKNYVDTFVWFIALVASMALVKSRTDSKASMPGI